MLCTECNLRNLYLNIFKSTPTYPHLPTQYTITLSPPANIPKAVLAYIATKCSYYMYLKAHPNQAIAASRSWNKVVGMLPTNRVCLHTQVEQNKSTFALSIRQSQLHTSRHMTTYRHSILYRQYNNKHNYSHPNMATSCMP